MPTPSAPIETQDVHELVSAISHNTQDGVLAKFLEPFRWSVLNQFVRPLTLQRGHLLIAQGALDRKLYFIESGDLKVDVKTDAGMAHLAILGPGTVVGEGSFFSHLARNASVTVYSDCKVWELLPQEFERLAKLHPSVAFSLSMALGAVLATRMIDLSKRVAVA